MNAIEVNDLSVSYRGRPAPAVDRVSFVAPAGKVLGLLGPNGAGKTTLVHAITTAIPITSGDAIVCGFSARTQPTRVRRVVGLMSQVETVDWGMTIRQQVEFAARLAGLTRKERARRIDELMQRFDLARIAGSDPGRVSGGQLKRMQLVRALLFRPSVLFLDEPTLGLDPLGVEAVLSEIRSITADGTTVALATNEMDQAAVICDSVVYIRAGRLIASGHPSELAAAHGGSLRQAFLKLAREGGSHDDCSTVAE